MPCYKRRPMRARSLILTLLAAAGCADATSDGRHPVAGDRHPRAVAGAAPADATAASREVAPEAREHAIFVDRAEAAGLDFVHFNGMSGELYLAEIMGSGAA